jgi:outer membrane protein TolC
MCLLTGTADGKQQDPNVSKKTGGAMTLRQAIQTALHNNRSLKRFGLNIALSRLNVKTRESEFDIKVMPTTSLGYHSATDEYWRVGVELLKKNQMGFSTSITPQIQRSGDAYRSYIDLSLTVPLLKGFGTEYNLDGIHSSLYELKNARRTLYQQQVSIVLSTVTTVYEIIKNQQQIQLLTIQLNGLENHLAVTKIKEKTGLATAMDLYRAELRLKDVKNEITILREQYENHGDQLKNLLAVPMRGDITVTAPVEYKPVVIDTEQSVVIALKNRIEIEQSQQWIKESRRKMILAKRDILPKLDLNVGYERFADDKTLDLTEDTWTLSLGSSTDFSRSNERTAYARSKINWRQAQIDLKNEEQRIVEEVRSQINSMTKKETLIADRVGQAQQVAGKLELAASKFNHGLADNFDLLEAQSQSQQVKTDLLSDTVDYIVGIYTLRAVLGTLIDRGETR